MADLNQCSGSSLKDLEDKVQKKFSGKNLLIISDMFPDEGDNIISSKFVKDQVNAIKDLFENIYVISVLSYYYKLTDVGKYCHDYSYENVHVYYPYRFFIPLRFTKKFLIDFRYKAVLNVIREHDLKFDIIHGHMTQPSGLICMILKEKYGVPYVLTIHENEFWLADEISSNHPSIVDSWKSADALIRVNKYDLPLLLKWNPNSYYVPNVFSSKYFPRDMTECRDKLGLSIGTTILFSLGNLIERKGFSYLIESVAQMNKDGHEIFCYIGGSGPEREHLQMLIDKYNMTTHIHLIGKISEEDSCFWMNAANLFVLPSLNESFGVVNIEAMACGTPVVGTNVGGVPSIIIDNRYGLLVEPASVDDLKNGILSPLTMSWNKMLIHKYAVDNYGDESLSNKLSDIYLSLLS